MTRYQIMQQAGVAALGQAKAIPQSVVFSTLINEDFISIQVTEDCSGSIGGPDIPGGNTLIDECGVCGGDCDFGSSIQSQTHQINLRAYTVKN